MKLRKIIEKLDDDSSRKPGEPGLTAVEKFKLLKTALKLAKTSFEIDGVRRRIVELKKAHPSLDEHEHKEHAPKKKGAKH